MRDKTPRLDQTHLIEQLIKFMAHYRNTPKIPLTEATRYRKGLCLGFSTLLAFKTAQDKGLWWKAVLEIISQTSIDEKALSTESTLPENTENVDYPNLYDIFLKTTGEILANQESLQGNILNLIQSHEKAAGHFSPSTLETLLDENLFHPQQICLIRSINHACAIHFQNNEWHFYDPNNQEGEVIFKNKLDLILKITATLGFTVCIEIINLDPLMTAKTTLFKTIFQKICDEKPTEVIERTGLHIMTYHSPKALLKIMRLANDNNEIRLALEEAIKLKSKKGCTGLHYLSQFEPACLSELNELAKNHEEIQEAIEAAKVLESAFKDFLETKNMFEEILIPIAIEIDTICNTERAMTLIEELFKIIPLYSTHTQLKMEFDREATLLDIDEAYNPFVLLSIALKNKVITNTALLTITMEVSENAAFTSIIKLTLIGIIKGSYLIESDNPLLFLKICLIEKIEGYLYDNPESKQKERLLLLKSEILNADCFEDITHILNLHLEQTTKSPHTGFFSEEDFGKCLEFCFKTTNAFIADSPCKHK